MQNDLISRSDLIETIEQDIKTTERFMEKLANLYKINSKEYACLNAQLNTLKSYKGIVEDKPCAYNVEKVVAELEEEVSFYEEGCRFNLENNDLKSCERATEHKICYLRAIDIVRNGGKE